MKSYVKPVLDYIELTVEERFASGSGSSCTISGTCPGDVVLIGTEWVPVTL